METSAPLINAIVNNALLYCNSRIKHMPLKSFTSCAFCGRLATPDFVMKCTEARAGLFSGQKFGSSTGLLHYCTFRLEEQNDAQNVRVDTARGKDNH